MGSLWKVLFLWLQIIDPSLMWRHDLDWLLKCACFSSGAVDRSLGSGDMGVLPGFLPGADKLRCALCGKTSSSQANLQKHMRVHTGERPYSCHLCNKSFTQGSHLYRHLRGIHHLTNVKWLTICTMVITTDLYKRVMWSIVLSTQICSHAVEMYILKISFGFIFI